MNMFTHRQVFHTSQEVTDLRESLQSLFTDECILKYREEQFGIVYNLCYLHDVQFEYFRRVLRPRLVSLHREHGFSGVAELFSVDKGVVAVCRILSRKMGMCGGFSWAVVNHLSTISSDKLY